MGSDYHSLSQKGTALSLIRSYKEECGPIPPQKHKSPGKSMKTRSLQKLFHFHFPPPMAKNGTHQKVPKRFTTSRWSHQKAKRKAVEPFNTDPHGTKCQGVWPPIIGTSMFAPFSTNNQTVSRQPLPAAKCKAVMSLSNVLSLSSFAGIKQQACNFHIATQCCDVQ